MRTKPTGAVMLHSMPVWFGWACLCLICGCANDVAPEIDGAPETTLTQPVVPNEQVPVGPAATKLAAVEPAVDSSGLDALTERLKQLTDEVEASPVRRAHGVKASATFHFDELRAHDVREIIMSVTVDWCNDGCVYGPAETPAHDNDLLLLLPFAKTLKYLDVQHTEITDVGLQTIAKLTELESLNLAGTAIDGGGLARLLTLHKLQHLDLRETKIPPDELSPLVGLTELRTVELSSSMITDDVLKVLGRLPHLQRVVLVKSPVTDHGLANLTGLKELTALDLSETDVTDAGLNHLAGLTNLTQLQLSQTKITGTGMPHLARLRHLQELDLTKTAVDDTGLVHLAGLRELRSLHLAGTKVRGHGLVHLKECRNLQTVTLPPISFSAVSAVNAVKSWRSLSLTLVSDEHLPPTDAATISDMPELISLGITCLGPLKQLRFANCPQLANVGVSHISHHGAEQQGAEQLPATSLQFAELPTLRNLGLMGSFNDLAGDEALRNVDRITLNGSLTSDTVRGINRCRGLVSLDLTLTDITGEPVPVPEVLEFSKAQAVTIRSKTAAAVWLTSLIGKMPHLQSLDMRFPRLTATDLEGLKKCTQLKHLVLHGIDDPGEPLAFLNSMPNLDQCLILGCPSAGRIYLSPRAGVRRLYFKYGRLDAIEIDGAPNLSAVYLGNEAHSYSDDDARLNKLDIGSLTVRSAPSLLYLMVDGIDSTTRFSDISLASIPILRSLSLSAPPADRQPDACRMTVEGEFSELVRRRLFHLSTSQASLDRLNASPILKDSQAMGVNVIADQ